MLKMKSYNWGWSGVANLFMRPTLNEKVWYAKHPKHAQLRVIIIYIRLRKLNTCDGKKLVVGL